jgi:hypothetical protein
MPFEITKQGSKYKVVTTATGKVHGTHPTKRQAVAQLRALYANVPEASEKSSSNRRKLLYAD